MGIENQMESEVKNLIIRAWRERWSDSKWGINIRAVIQDGDETDVSFLADAILQQALNGPGPNNLVLSYLKHSVFSHVISTTAVLQSISQYHNFYKPFCLASLLDFLDEIKSRAIRVEVDSGDCLGLCLSLQAIIYWLLSVMYSSLEKISDMADFSELTVEVEDSKIVTKCRKLLEYFFTDPFLKALLYIASMEAPKVHENIQKMCRENLKFAEGFHGSDISAVISFVEGMRDVREITATEPAVGFAEPFDSKLTGVNGAIQTTVMIAAMLRTTNDVSLVADDLLVIKQLKGMDGIELYCDVIHSGMIGLADAIGKDSELKFIGFTFLQLPALLRVIHEKMRGGANGTEDLRRALDTFILNESTLDIIDSKLHCASWDLFLAGLHKNGLLDEEHKDSFQLKRNPSTFAQKKNSSNAVIMIKAEMTVLNVLKILDGDYLTQQEKIFSLISSMLGETFETFLIAASSTGVLQQVTARLIKLNQLSKQVNGESSKASTTRAVIFDSSFLALCHIMQSYGPQYLPEDSGDCFFEDWYRNCMAVESDPKSPDTIVAKCDQKKVDLLLNQYLNQADNDLKTSLVLWHELCFNSVGVVADLLLAWSKDAISVTDVKKVLDVFRSKICALPVCIAAWLCSFIQIMPEEECGKARYMLEHLSSPLQGNPSSEEGQDNFKDRRRLMVKIINNMNQSTIHSLVPGSHSSLGLNPISDSKQSRTLFENCWTKRANRGIMDVQTTILMKNLLRISGPSNFVSIILQRIFEIQHKAELVQWRELAYGILHMDFQRCIPEFLKQMLPCILQLTKRHEAKVQDEDLMRLSHLYFSIYSEMSCVEPQGIAIVLLGVELTLSYYLHGRMENSDSAEPQAKRRRGNRDKSNIAPGSDLEGILKRIFQDFNDFLSGTNELSPHALLIFRFLKEIAIKSPDPTIHQTLSPETVNTLISILGNQLSPNLLLALHSMRDRTSRGNCAQAISRLKILQEPEEFIL